ncbi:uncharacterized protein BO66DRAFT_390495 [Aspergillus aculeatinus CBS 121060]|uniref:Uncharacterized protein n=1 Tax=Aspergillus aculeatinus CBS 121060 TaxID=1448322 RepID=A0ACD1HF20_9EURO|nr:hypothetical protein BO66DRAFT_390495 [Aspergillus aculeatinus CBS 121060]RAH72010.1 hypothetical protein BO66DRAFT_390495 [Aspergillus aculeatinus CBS 121060]
MKISLIWLLSLFLAVHAAINSPIEPSLSLNTRDRNEPEAHRLLPRADAVHDENEEVDNTVIGEGW